MDAEAAGEAHRESVLARVLLRRGSVWHYLVAIAVVPCVGLIALTGLIARDRLHDASQAGRMPGR